MVEDSYKLIIFVKGNGSEEVLRLSRESELVEKFAVEILDINSPKSFMKKIAYRCVIDNSCAVTDMYGCLILTLNKPPNSFFHLKEILISLGYLTVAKSINWIPQKE